MTAREVLSRWQMAHLEELGVDTSDAGVGPCPAYTATDIVNKLPKSILEYHLMVEYKNNRVCYVLIRDGNIAETYHSCGIGDSLINALYDMLCWVAVNYKERLWKK